MIRRGEVGLPEFYDATGALSTANTSSVGNPYLFTGRRWDEELGYYYYRNRYMDPALGRFVSRDPIGLWGDAANLGNGYTYAASNPWSLVDPFGLESGGNIRSDDDSSLSPTTTWERIKAIAKARVEFNVERKKGHVDVLVGMALAVVDDWYLRINPFARHKKRMDDIEYYKQIAQDPKQAIADVEDAAKDYVENFDARNLGQVEATIGVAYLTRKVGPGGASAATSRVKGVWDKVRQWFNPKCFVAGTLVLTTTGMVPIEDIGVGDLVYSRDDATLEESYQPVLQTFETPDMVVWDVEFTFNSGDSETITATYGHPFWAVGDGWTHTEDLEVGMEVSTSSEGTATVVALTLVDETHTVYNFEVANTHTYFVGDARVWVHNANGPCDPPVGRQLEFDFVEEFTEKKTHLYQKVDKDGNHLKFGVTSSPDGRYSQQELNGGRLRIIADGSNDEMLRLERNLHSTLPLGIEEGQDVYKNIQRRRGLKP